MKLHKIILTIMASAIILGVGTNLQSLPVSANHHTKISKVKANQHKNLKHHKVNKRIHHNNKLTKHLAYKLGEAAGKMKTEKLIYNKLAYEHNKSFIHGFYKTARTNYSYGPWSPFSNIMDDSHQYYPKKHPKKYAKDKLMLNRYLKMGIKYLANSYHRNKYYHSGWSTDGVHSSKHFLWSSDPMPETNSQKRSYKQGFRDSFHYFFGPNVPNSRIDNYYNDDKGLTELFLGSFY